MILLIQFLAKWKKKRRQPGTGTLPSGNQTW
jgi:hypothetical protein